MDIKTLTDRILRDGKLTRSEHQTFLNAVNADGKIDAEEKAQIDRIFKLIQDKELRVV